ncbi:MAG: hypothetical protein JHD16_06990 [Solirubrobacteraceae bacterium]|nr:hypothetical protein [Solirubrobacteraceae bacterium]
MHAARARATSSAAALLASIASLGLASPASAAPAVGELVSRADGATGAPLGFSKLAGASADGRFVVFEPTPGGIPSRQLLIRDRQLGTTTPVPEAGDGYSVSDVSDDGRYVLTLLRTYSSGLPEKVILHDVTAGTATALNTSATGAPLPKVAWTAKFLNGGPTVLYGAADESGNWAVYRRATPTAAPTTVASGVKLADATRSGHVITWTRTLPIAKRPAGNHGPVSRKWPDRAGEASGYTIAGQEPKVAARTTYVENANAPAEYCIDGGVSTVITSYGAPTIDDYGHTLTLASSVFDERFPSGPHVPQTRLFDVSEDGRRTMSGTTYWNGPGGSTFNVSPASGTAGLPLLPELPMVDIYKGGNADGALFYAHDTGILRSESRPDASSVGIYAYDPVDTGTEPAVKTPSDLPGATADDPQLTADVTWDECDDVTAPPRKQLGDISQYANIQLASPATLGKSAGTVKVTLYPSQYVRPFPLVTIQVRTLGFTTWQRTIRADETVVLPRPFWLVPQTVVVKAEAAADPANGLVAEMRQTSQRWQALR